MSSLVKPLVKVWSSVSYAAHQSEGIRWMMNQERVGFQASPSISVHGGILGDEMGLGKTIETLGLIVNNRVKRTLILMPLAVRKQWEEAIQRCDLNLYVAEKTGWTPIGKQKLRPSVFLGHYDRLVSNIAQFQEYDWDRIVLDEAHRIRNSKTITGLSVHRLVATYKWCLTATPIVNTLDDAVSYLMFIGCPIDTPGSWSPQYQSWVRGCFLARKLGECEPPAGLTMPPTPEVHKLDLEFTNEDEEKIYSGILNNLEHQWRRAQANGGKAAALQRLAILLRLRQVSVNPQVYINARQRENFGYLGPEFIGPSRKFEEIVNLIRDDSYSGGTHGWIIFCQFREEITLLRQYLEAFDFIGKVREYHGGMTMDERNAAVEGSRTFTDGLQDVLLIQLHAGGTGLNLQHYDRVVFTSPWWTAALLDQALGRALRIGQKNVVQVYWLRLQSESIFNIDEFVLEKSETKRDLANTFHTWSIQI